jgi:gliding motility-associated-like protein
LASIHNIGKKLGHLLIIGTCLFTTAHAQNSFIVSGSTRLVTTGGAQVTLSGGKFNLINNGTISGNAGGATWIFKAPVELSGTGATRVSNLIIDHSFGITQLLSPISVMNTATLAAGKLETNDNLLIRSDMNNIANLVVTAIPEGDIQGLVAKASVTAGACPSFTSTLSLNISGTQLTYQWQSSPDSVTWTNISGATSSTYDVTVSGPVYYRCQVGATSGDFNQIVTPVKLMLDLPDSTISGAVSLLLGNTATFTAATAGGTWASSNPGVLTVNALTGLITGINSGSAMITYSVTNSSGCTSVGRRTITVGNGIKPAVVITDPAAVCAPATVDLTAAAVTAGSDAGLTYSYYSDAAGTVVLNSPNVVAAGGTYYIKGTNSNNVESDIVPVIVTINPLPGGSISSAAGTTLCGPGASLLLTASGGDTYTWFRNGVAITGVSGNQLSITLTGTYTARLRSAAGCEAAATNSLVITSFQSLQANFSYDSYCINQPVAFTNTSVTNGTSGITWQWTDTRGNTSAANAPSFTYNQTGSVSMKLKMVSAACPSIADSITQTFTIEVPTVALRMQPPTQVVINEPITLQARTFGKSYAWSPATGLSNASSGAPLATLTADQEYRIAITAPSGCITVDSLLVRVYADRVYIPTVFTPNDDGVNDKLLVNLAGVQKLQYFKVYNRYGKLMFQTTDPAIGWDGRFNNVPQPIDTYVWVVVVRDNNTGAVTTKNGNTTLLR